MRYYLVPFILLAIVAFSCKKIQPAQTPCDTQDVVIPQDTSFLSTPLVIPTRLIEDKLNHAIKKDILNDEDFENVNKEGKKDKLKLKVVRLGDIEVSWKNNVARYQAPLLVLIERQIVSKKVLPTSKSLALKTEFSLRLVVETTVDIGRDWKLQPQTKFIYFEWLSEVKALGGLIDLKKIIERRLARQMPDITKNMDEAIRSSVRLDRAVQRIWQNIQKPMIINRKDQMVWLKVHPIQFEMGTISTEAGNLLIQGRLSATTETIVGDNPAYTVDSILPPLVKRDSLPNEAYAYLLSEISYADINLVLDRKLTGKEFNLSGHRVKVKSAEVWGCGSNLVLHLQVGGGVRGDIYFQGIPRFEPDSQRITIESFNFEVKTEEVLLASADWLLHSVFKEQIKDALSIPLGEKITNIPAAIMAGIERGKAGSKLDFIIECWDLRPQKIWVRPTDIVALVTVNAQARVILEKI